MTNVMFNDYSKGQVNGQYCVRPFHTEAEARSFITALINHNNRYGFTYGEIELKEDKPQEGKIYALTGNNGNSILNGKSWSESVVNN